MTIVSFKRKRSSRKDVLFIDMQLTRSDRIFHAVSGGIITAILLIVLIPLLNVLASSFSSGSAVSSGKVFIWPVDFSLTGYEKVFSYPRIWRSYGNTIFYTVVGTAINIAMTLMAAYPLASRTLPFRGFFMFLFTFTMLFGGGMIPTYLVFKQIGMLNTVWAMLIPGAMSVYNMIIARTFIQGIPADLREAAHLDGCSDARYFFMIVLPLSVTMISVLTLYYAVGHWNSYFPAMMYLSDRDMMPLQILLRDVLLTATIDTASIPDGETAAAMEGMSELLRYSLIVVASAPILCLYPFLQKYFVKGVLIGSIKG